MEVKGKLAIITGSGQGLGKAFACKLLQAGAFVCLSDVDEVLGDKALKELSEKFGETKVHFIKCNVLSKDDIVNLYEGSEQHFKSTVDIFCNNAGINHLKGWKLCMDIDIMAVMECTEYVLDKMDITKGGKGGLIVNTASMAGIAYGNAWEPASYYVAKHGVVALTRTLGKNAFEKATGVKVQCICPSFVETGIFDNVDAETYASVKEKYGIMTPEYVADGFFKLVTSCKTGDAMAIVKDVPPMIYSDLSAETVKFLAVGSLMFSKLFGVDLFTQKHQLLFMFIVYVLANFLLYSISNYLFF